MAVPDEEELVRKGMDLIESNKLWAGLVFLDIEEGRNIRQFLLIVSDQIIAYCTTALTALLSDVIHVRLLFIIYNHFRQNNF